MRPHGSHRPVWLGLGLLLCLAFPLAGPLLTGFERGLLDPGDSRLAVFILERNTEWLLGGGGEHAPWDLGIFFPRSDTLLFSDTFFGQTPFWAVLRWLGADRVVAFHLLLGCFLALNFLAAERLLTRTLRLPPAPAFLGAMLFALGSPRLAHLFHLQLVAQFPLILFVSAIAEAFEPADSPSLLRQVATGFAIGGWWALLFHFTPYMAWFAALAALFALGLALLFRAGREALHRLFTRRLASCIAAAAVAGALVLPVLVRYLEVARAVGVRPAEQAVLLLLPPSAWLYQGPWSILYGRFSSWLPISAHPYESELRLGLGWVTSALVLYGLWLGRRRPLVFWTVLPGSALCLLLSTVGGFEVWSFVRPWLPGAGAFRAMSRAGLLALLPASLGLGLAFSAPVFARRPGLVWLLGLLVAAEQLQDPPLYSRDIWQMRSDAIRAALPADCPSFYYSPMAADLPVEFSQLDAMWASLDSGIPTINGYSGALPPEWLLFDHAVPGRRKKLAVARNLGSWLERHGLESTCWVRGTAVARVRAGHDARTKRIFEDDLESGGLARWAPQISR